MRLFKKLVSDFFGIVAVLGIGYAIRWLISIFLNSREIVAARNLRPADRSMGEGPFPINMRRYALRFLVTGEEAFSGIREMYVRDTYLRRGLLEIEDGDLVVDLGANMGNFTNLALAHGSKVRVLSVEPNGNSNEAFRQSLSLNNGFKERATLVRAFLGVPTNAESKLAAMPEYGGAAFLSEVGFVRDQDIDRVDFLKCDIEGGEFGLLGPESLLLRMARKLAIEIHSFAGDVDVFIEMLRSHPDGTATVLASRR
jgi:FkbM family methyltransferase